MAITLGSKVRDTITGMTGIVIARTVWLHGCARLTIQPLELKEGRPVDGCTIDEPQAEIIKEKVAKAGNRRTGGPRAEPTRNIDPQRP